MAKFESNEINNWEHQHGIVAKRVMLAGMNQQLLVDEASATITYVGFGARGLAKDAEGWLIMKINTGGSLATEINTAIDTWDNRGSATYA